MKSQRAVRVESVREPKSRFGGSKPQTTLYLLSPFSQLLQHGFAGLECVGVLGWVRSGVEQRRDDARVVAGLQCQP